MTKISVVKIATAAGFLLLAPQAMAGDRGVSWSISIGTPAPVVTYSPAPVVVVQPQPVYVVERQYVYTQVPQHYGPGATVVHYGHTTYENPAHNRVYGRFVPPTHVHVQGHRHHR